MRVRKSYTREFKLEAVQLLDESDRSLSWSAPVAFVAMATLFASYGLMGLGQCIFLALMFAWLLIAAHGLSVGAYSSHR